ncbi:MAG: xanthine dehydrogenase family protein subunit M [Chloroflexi bacterium]|nr:xanthine dehydrogenase family protein subunit M [Chloroflexota bacterium]
MGMMRRLPRFDYLAPTTLQEACAMLQQHQGQAKLLAGGTDLLVNMKRRDETPQYVIGLKQVSGLDYVRDGDTLHIGPLAVLHQLELSPAVRQKWPILVEACDHFGSTQIRNLATVAGNLCSASPSADMATPLIVLGARLKLKSASGERQVAADQFFVAPFKTVMREDEILADIEVPALSERAAAVYERHSLREAMDHALVGVSVMVQLGRGTTCQDAHIALGACAPTPRRAPKAEAALRGKQLTAEVIAEAAKTASTDADPRTDPEYKRQIVEVLTRRALNRALTEVQGK